MTLVLDATVGGLTANAYLTQSAAQAILDGVPNADAWTTADATAGGARDQALVYSAQLLDALAYEGFKTNVGQARVWPRGGVLDPDYGDTSAAFQGYMVNGSQWGVYLDMNAIPVRIKRASAMLALEILRAGTSDVWGVDSSANVVSESVDVLKTQYTDIHYRRLGLRAYPSVWREVWPLTLASHPADVTRA